MAGMHSSNWEFFRSQQSKTTPMASGVCPSSLMVPSFAFLKLACLRLQCLKTKFCMCISERSMLSRLVSRILFVMSPGMSWVMWVLSSNVQFGANCL